MTEPDPPPPPASPAPTDPPSLRCSFCDKPRAAVRALVAGPGLSICDECVQAGAEILFGETAEPVPPDTACSFCDRTRPEIGVLIPGPRHHICDACVQLCTEILGELGHVQAPAAALPVARVRASWWRRWLGRG
jgi:ATP-dependent protease Clp ATPase subunit